MSALSAALRHAVKWKRLARNDLPTIEKPDDGEAKTLVLPRSQIMAIADAGTPAVRLFTLIAYFTASRRAAIERLSWFQEIGRAHGWTPVPNAHPVCRLLLE